MTEKTEKTAEDYRRVLEVLYRYVKLSTICTSEKLWYTLKHSHLPLLVSVFLKLKSTTH
jgi:hypothetical protein